MKVISPSYEIMFMPEGETLLKTLELAGRTCYKSEEKINADSAKGFVKRILKSGHHSVIEHAGITVRFICDRGVTHELVRHRLAAYSQESTRYANYWQSRFGQEITVIKPFFWEEDSPEYALWLKAMAEAEKAYMALIERGAKPEEARSVLPNSLKTEIVMTANIREWRHVFELRCSKAAHPQIRQIMLPLLDELHRLTPVIFDDLYDQYEKDIEKMKRWGQINRQEGEITD
ncbi:MAG: FAD-dependent thymidylate synthase [Pseudomonadota bacterium]